MRMPTAPPPGTSDSANAAALSTTHSTADSAAAIFFDRHISPPHIKYVVLSVKYISEPHFNFYLFRGAFTLFQKIFFGPPPEATGKNHSERNG